MFSVLSLWWSGALSGWIALCHTDEKKGMIFDIRMVTCACCGPTEVSKGQSYLGCLRDFLEGNTAPKSSSRMKSPGAEIMEKRLELPLSARCLTGFPLICLWLLKDMPSTTNGFTKTGDQVSVSEGVLSSFPCPEPPRRPPSPCSPYEPLSSKLHFLDSARVCSKRDHGVKQLCGSCFLCLFFSPFSLLPPSIPLSSPLSLNLLHCSWTSPWIKTLSKNPLFKVISNFSARLSEICLFEGRIRCDRRFIVT